MDKRKIIKRMAMAEVPFAIAQTGLKTPTTVEIRRIVIQLLYSYEYLNQNQIADLIHCTQGTVSRIMKNRNLYAESHPDFLDKLNQYSNNYKYAISKLP